MADKNRVVAEEVRRVSPVVGSRRDEIFRTVIAGIGVGVVVSLLLYLLEQLVFVPLLCGQDAGGSCANVTVYSSAVAMLVGAVAGLVAMTTMQVYRPLLVVLAVTVGLWSFHTLVVGMVWYWTIPIAAVMFGLAYALFAWLARIRAFILAVVVAIIVVVLVRLMIAA